METIDSRNRIITWNCRRAREDSAIWGYLKELSPDIALLQEVSGIAPEIMDMYNIQVTVPITKSGKPQKFQTVVLTRGIISDQFQMGASEEWIARELDIFSGNLSAFRIDLFDGSKFTVVCVYSPAWPVPSSHLQGIDVSGVKLTQSPDVWVADLLWASLNFQRPDPSDYWIIAGDFNSSETFDQWPGGPWGNREYLDRMTSLGLIECLCNSQGKLTPTFRNPKGGKIKHQIDDMFVTAGLATRLIRCHTGSEERVFGGSLSDHLPVIADFSRNAKKCSQN